MRECARKNPGAIGRMCGLVDQGTPPQLVKRQRRVYPTRVVEVAVYEPVEDMTNVKPPSPSGGVSIPDNVDGAAVTQQVIELWPIGELVDPRQVDQQEAPHIIG